MNLSHNRIINIEESTFKNFHNLVFLNLSHNWIQIETHMFRDLILLEKLDLSFNGIKYINVQQFTNCTKLTHLILNKNQIKEICSECFTNLNALEYLSIESNEINKIEKDSFNYLHSLKEFFFGSKVSTLSFFWLNSDQNHFKNTTNIFSERSVISGLKVCFYF